MTETPAADIVEQQLSSLQEWLREPDVAEKFGNREILDWINRRPTHVVPKVLATIRGEIDQ